MLRMISHTTSQDCMRSFWKGVTFAYNVTLVKYDQGAHYLKREKVSSYFLKQ